jgi:hypothetical protein
MNLPREGDHTKPLAWCQRKDTYHVYPCMKEELTRKRSKFESRYGQECSLLDVQTRPVLGPTQPSDGYGGLFCWEYSGRGVKPRRLNCTYFRGQENVNIYKHTSSWRSVKIAGHAVTWFLRHYARRRKVSGSRPDEVN